MTQVCECGHDAGSHNALRFNCLATIGGTHATRCACKAFAPQSCTCGTLPPHLHRRGCFVYAPRPVSPEAAREHLRERDEAPRSCDAFPTAAPRQHCGCRSCTAERHAQGFYAEAAPPIERMPKIGKDALPVGEPLTCAHGTWTRPHVIRCMRCFPEAARCDETSHEWRYSLTSGGYVCATCGLEAFPIADEPEAAPPRATTPEPLTEDELAAIRRHHEARYTPNWMHSERLLREVDRLRSSEGAREAERLREELAEAQVDLDAGEFVGEHAILCRVFDDVDEVYAEWDAYDKSGWLSRARALGGFIRGRLDARASEGAREAERLRAAVEAYVEAWEAKDFADCIEADDADTLALQQLRGREKARAFGALRASLRATPPETETEP